MRAPRSTPLPGESGVALVIVLWVLVLLSVIAGSLVFSSRTELQMAGNLSSLARAEALADAGVHKAIYELNRTSTDVQRWQGDGLTHPWSFNDATVRVRIVDESAKVDLNAAPALLLKGLSMALGIAEADAEAIADAIVDWRDADDLRSLHGAEKADYAAAGRPYGPANVPFETIEELQQVLGMNNALYRQLEPLVTVHSQRNGINPALAPRLVLLALPGATPEQVDAYLELRRIALEQQQPAPLFPAAGGFSAGATGTVFSIQAEGVLGDNARFFREAVIRLTGNRNEPVVFLAWRAPFGSLGDPAPAPGKSN